MPSDLCNSTMAKATVPFAIPLYMQFILHDLPGPSFVSYSSLLTMKSVEFVAGM